MNSTKKKKEKQAISLAMAILGDDDTLREVMRELGRRGGSKTSDAKKEAASKSLEKARAVRWGKPVPRKSANRKKQTFDARLHEDCTHERNYCVLEHGDDFKD
jgi:hypothetical protein